MWLCTECGEANDSAACARCGAPSAGNPVIPAPIDDSSEATELVFHTDLAPDEAARTLVECFCGPRGLLGAVFSKTGKGRRGRRPSDMTGWGWAQASGPDADGQYVFRIARGMPSLTVRCQVTPDDSGGSLVRIEWPGVVGVHRSVIAMETRLLRSELRAT